MSVTKLRLMTDGDFLTHSVEQRYNADSRTLNANIWFVVQCIGKSQALL